MTWTQNVEHIKEILLKGDWYASISSKSEGQREEK